ncbi:hypothetical protein [Niveibacterium sp. SC-1]
MSLSFLAYYCIAILVLVMHFAGVLSRYRMQWLMYLLALSVAPAVFFL